MAFSFIRSLVKNTLKHLGDGLTGGVVPIGSIAASIFDDWCKEEAIPAVTDGQCAAPAAAAQLQVRIELEKIVQDCRGYRDEIKSILEELRPSEQARQTALSYLDQVPGRIQASMRRTDDPTGKTLPATLLIRGPEDLHQVLPDKMPRFKAGDRPVAGTDLVVTEFLGIGGFGEVWQAVHQRRPHAPAVALKFCTQASAAQSLRKEVELLDRVANQGRHKGIVELKYAHLEGDTPCLEYELVGGGDLSEFIAEWHRAKKASPLQIAKVMYSLATPVGFAHRLRPPIVHRDLKPQNILTARTDGKVHFKVADFGIGGVAMDQALQEWHRETRGSAAGASTSAGSCTPLYASPQQRRLGPPDPRDDVYALGVIWYQMITGDVTKEPPRGGSWKRKFLERGATPNMVELLERCIEDDPAERPADAQVLADELARLVRPPSEAASIPDLTAPQRTTEPETPGQPEIPSAPAMAGWRKGIKQAAWGCVGGFGIFFCALPLVVVVAETIGLDSPWIGVPCILLLLGFLPWFCATKLRHYPWRWVGGCAAISLLVLVLGVVGLVVREKTARPRFPHPPLIKK